MKEVEELVVKMRPQIMAMYEFLHENPEVSWKEYNTTKYITKFLRDHGAKVRLFDDHTGVIGEIGEGKPVVAVRADMDALWQEVNGRFQANHSCGHDAHMSIVAGTLLTLNAMRKEWKGTVRFIFQPAEEKGTGALKFVDQGVVDDVDYLFGLHLRPFQELEDKKAAPAIYHGAARFYKGMIRGDDTHGARPHLGKNAIEIGMTIVSMLNSIHINPMHPHSVKMTSFLAGGESFNIIPGSATFSIDVRAQENETMDILDEKIRGIITTLEQLYGVELQLEPVAFIAAAEVNPDAQRIMEMAIVDALGQEGLHPAIISTGGDDFHYYTIKRPHLKATMLGLGCHLTPGLHHPNMTFNKNALFKGIHILTLAVIRALSIGENTRKED